MIGQRVSRLHRSQWAGVFLGVSFALAGFLDVRVASAATRAENMAKIPAFTETAETLKYGFDIPFPNVTRRTFAVETYGAKADGTTDCTAAFNSAVAAAIASGVPAKVVFNKAGNYYFKTSKTGDTNSILYVKNANNLLVCGQGASTVLQMGDMALGGICVQDSNRVMLQNFSIDYKPLGFTQGVVSALDTVNGNFNLTLTTSTSTTQYPTPAVIDSKIPANELKGGYLYYQTGSYGWLPIGYQLFSSITLVSGSVWKFQASDVADFANYCSGLGMTNGSSFVYVGRRIGQPALFALNTKAFYLKNVNVYASPSCGLLLINAEGVNIDGYSDMIREGTTRLLSSNADGIWCGVRDGITIKNSYWMGQGDDNINLHAPAFPGSSITKKSDTNIVFSWYQNLRKGDVLEIMNPSQDLIKGQVTIASVIQQGSSMSGTTECVLNQGLSTVGYSASTDYIYPVSISSSNFKIVHNYFGQQRAGRILIQARNGLIQSNCNENAEGWCIVMGYGGTAWTEGILPRDVKIKNNIFRNVTNSGLNAAIEGYGGTGRYVSNILIDGNTFINVRKWAIGLNGGNGVTISNNTTSTASGLRNTWNGSQWYPIDCSIYLKDSTGVNISNYTLTDPNITGCGIYVDATCAPTTSGVQWSGITATIPANILAVIDARNGVYVSGGSMDSAIPLGWSLSVTGVYNTTGGNPGGCIFTNGWNGWEGGNLNAAFPSSSTTQVRVQFDYKAGDGYVYNGDTYVPGVRFGIHVGNSVADGWNADSGTLSPNQIQTTSTTTWSHYDSGWITLNSADLSQLSYIYIQANPMAGPTLYAGTGYYDNVSVTTR